MQPSSTHEGFEQTPESLHTLGSTQGCPQSFELPQALVCTPHEVAVQVIAGQTQAPALHTLPPVQVVVLATHWPLPLQVSGVVELAQPTLDGAQTPMQGVVATPLLLALHAWLTQVPEVIAPPVLLHSAYDPGVLQVT